MWRGRGRGRRWDRPPPPAVDAPSDVEASPGRLRPRKRQRVDKGKDKAEDRPLPAVAPLPHNPARGLRARAANDPETLYREIRALRIYEGATEVQKLVIARQILA